MSEPFSTKLDDATTVWTFPGEREFSHLLIRGDDAILIDCHHDDLASRMRGLPIPGLVLHTHIAPEHCREGCSFPSAQVMVHEPDATLAFEPDRVARVVKEQQADLDQWADLLGREPFGIAGCQTEFPPARALPRGGTFRIGERLRVGRLEVEVIGLPFHGRNAVGFIALSERGEPLGIFTGDLLLKGGYLVDGVSILQNYLEDRLDELPDLLERVLEYGSLPVFPATGRPMVNAKEAEQSLHRLLRTTHDFLKARGAAPNWEREEYHDPLRLVGRFREVSPGIFNLTQSGNVIVLIDEAGNGLMVDPGPCDYANPCREDDFIADLKRLETAAGLRRVELVLITHYHGDHVDMTHLVRARYPDVKVATWEKVAEVLEQPERFNLSAKLPWYGLGLTTVSVDLWLPLGLGFHWGERPIEVLHLPGHAWAHAGFLLHFRGRSLAITGDTVQISTKPDGLFLCVTNRAAPTEEEGNLTAYRQLVSRKIDLNLGGHGSWFENCAPLYQQSLHRITQAQKALEALFEPGAVAAAYQLKGSGGGPTFQ